MDPVKRLLSVSHWFLCLLQPQTARLTWVLSTQTTMLHHDAPTENKQLEFKVFVNPAEPGVHGV